MESRVLFICTGNYYRSRFAEAVFNHHAESLGLNWRAFSRGLAIHLVPPQFMLSPDTREHLMARNMDLRHTAPGRMPLRESDLSSSEIIIALKEEEHRPMIRARFRDWEKRVIFWDVGDQPEVKPDDGLGAIELKVEELVEQLSGVSVGTSRLRKAA